MSPFLLGVGSAASPVDPDARYVATDNSGDAASTYSSSAFSTEVSRVRYRALSDLIGPAPVYGNFGYGEADNPNNVTIEAAVEYPNGTMTLVEWEGAPSKLMVPGGLYVPDAHSLAIPEGAFFYVRSGATVTPGDAYRQAHGTNDTIGEGVERDSGTGKVTSGVITPVYGAEVVAPLGILSSGSYRPTCALVGDSNTIGLTVGRDRAFGAQACIDAGIGFVQLGQSIEKAQMFASVAGRHNRIRLAALCSTALCAYGTNDFNESRTAANVKTDNLAIWNALKTAGVTAVFQTTIIPMASSTNGWVDLVNQTVHANDAARTAYNDWLRAGAPLDPLTLEPTTIGASGAVTCDVYNASKVKILTGTGAPHPLVAVMEAADTVESSRNSGKWKTTGVVADQFHPGDAGHVLMAAAVPTELFV